MFIKRIFFKKYIKAYIYWYTRCFFKVLELHDCISHFRNGGLLCSTINNSFYSENSILILEVDGGWVNTNEDASSRLLAGNSDDNGFTLAWNLLAVGLDGNFGTTL